MEQKEGSKASLPTNFKASETRFFFPTALIIVFVLVFSVIFFNALFNGSEEKVLIPSANCDAIGAESLELETDKEAYAPGETIKLHVENRGTSVIYFESCADIDVFEKNESGEWILKQGDETRFSQEQNDFSRQSGDTDCEIGLPEDGAGSYRVVLPIFYGCTKSSQYACDGSRVFRSNAFEVAAAEKESGDRKSGIE